MAQGLKDAELVDFFSSRNTITFTGEVFRTTRLGLRGTTPSAAGGRWMAKDNGAVLYTSLAADGAMAEMSFHLNQLTPPPSKPVVLHRLKVRSTKVMSITYADFAALKIDSSRFGNLDYDRCQIVGDAISFIGCDAMLVPSARCSEQNLVLIYDNFDAGQWPEEIDSEEVDWQNWARRQKTDR